MYKIFTKYLFAVHFWVELRIDGLRIYLKTLFHINFEVFRILGVFEIKIIREHYFKIVKKRNFENPTVWLLDRACYNSK